MQTFLPYPDYLKSMQCLDTLRLRNQTLREAVTLINGGWRNHPASRMWRPYKRELCNYALAGIVALSQRGHLYIAHGNNLIRKRNKLPDNGKPPWLGDPDFHASHRSNLLRKDPEWYGQFGWTEPDDLPYVWP